MYQFDDLTFEPLFSRLSIQLERGRLHTLTGPNGSGKSTLLRLLCESDPSACLVNQKFYQMVANRFSFEDNLRFAALPTIPLPWFFPKKRLILPAFVERFGINKRREAHLLSGGQRQILALLMVLQKHPSLLLLDEPTAALDPQNAKMVFEFLQALVEDQGLTVLIVCHDPKLAVTYRTGRSLQIEMSGSDAAALRTLCCEDFA